MLADPVLLGQHHDRAALGGLVGERGHLRRLGQLGLLDAGHRHELGRLAVAERDRAGLVEQQHVDVAGRLDRAARRARARCGAPGGPCRRSRSRRAARRSWSGSARRAARSASRPRHRCRRTRPSGAARRRPTRKMIVSPASRMLSAISFGVLRRSAPSTRAIIRSRKLLPGSWVISTTIRSESTRVPPVTALRSPPASRITGADSPVIADSSTEAIPSITVPSPGIISPAVTTTTSPLCSSDAGTSRPSFRWATVSVRAARSASACALPRPSASASARLAKTTVSQSQSGDA